MSTFAELQNQAVAELKTQPVLDFFTNQTYPNLLYGQFLNDEQLKNLAILSKSNVQKSYLENRTENEPTLEELKENFKNVTYPQRLQPFLRQPLDLNVNEFFPIYATNLRQYEESLKDKANPEQILQRQYNYTRGNLPDRYASATKNKPVTPIGYEQTDELIKAGYNPGNILDATRFKLAMNFFAGSNYTPETANYAVENVGVVGKRDEETKLSYFGQPNPKFYSNLEPKFAYAIPNNPNNSIAYFADMENPQIVDAPFVSGLDYLEFAAAEGLPIIAEIFAGNKIMQGKKLTNLAQYGIQDIGTLRKGANKLGEYGMLGGSAALTLFGQRLLGESLGYHDYTLGQMAEETALLGALSVGGQGVIDGFMKGLPQIYKFISGGRTLDTNEMIKFRQLLDERAKQYNEGGTYKNVFEGKDISIKDINDAIIVIASDVQRKIGKFDPTAAQATKDAYFADLEKLLKTEGAVNSDYVDWFKQTLAGNTKVRDNFFKAVFDGLDTSMTGATIADEVGGAINSQRQEFVQKGQLIINDFIEEFDSFKQTGARSAVEDVYSADYATEIRPVFQKLITERTNEYRKVLNEQDVEYLNTIGLSDTPIKRANPQLRAAADALDAVNNFDNIVSRGLRAGDRAAKKEIDEVFPADLRTQLTAYNNNDFTIPELFALRKQVGQYRNSLNTKIPAELKFNDKFLALENSLDSQILTTARRELSPAQFAEFKIYQSEAFRKMSDTYNPVLTEIAKKNPEQILPYFLNQTTPGTSVNTPLRNFVNHLDQLGAEGQSIKNSLQNDLIDNIRFNVFSPDKTPVEQSKAYFRFMQDNRALVKEIFQEDSVSKFADPKVFREKFLPEIDAYEASLRKLNDTFGEGDAYNIVSNIFNRIDNTGQAFNQLEQLMNIINSRGSKKLQKDVTQIFKKYIYDASSTNGVFDFNKFQNFINTKFSPDEAAGISLSFRGVANLVMGNRAGDKFVKNMNVLSEMSDRLTQGFYDSDAAVLKSLSESFENPELNYLKRFIIPPLTQLGRRVTAVEKNLRERNANFLRTLIMDASETGGELFDAYVRGLESNRAARTFLKLYTNYQIRSGEQYNLTKDYEQSKYTTREKDIIRNRQEAEQKRINDLIGQEQADNIKQILEIARKAGVEL